ncbi:MerR family transcriptional regulator [Nocardia fusca]|uniref:MerR family transcriptional regulator n=1 Tax=Nocardia fusca TaxID=941183 RepID=UPI0037AC2DCE
MRETDPTDDAAIGFTVGTVAQALDIPVATLRSWNQRYGLGPPRRNPGEHRYYTPSDVAVLGRTVDLVRAGAHVRRRGTRAGGRRPARLLLAGPGWPVTAAFPGARRVDSLEDALGDIVRSIHAHRYRIAFASKRV